ncbi:MAG: metallophosphoesterase [Synechococcaceae cyanobacterium SM2_3_1]|nr:metallophosphoesterase [Synechococcaceae cyanobacterium SM2_3_1]
MLRSLALCLGIVLVVASSCSSSIPTASIDPGIESGDTVSALATAQELLGERFRVAFIADTHIIDESSYECCENSPRDTESIYLTAERLEQARAQINEINPPPDFVILLGDVFHDGYLPGAPEDLNAYRGRSTSMGRAAQILQGFNMPVYPLWGNHDYDVPAVSQEFSHQIFKEFFNADPYYSIDHKGWKFILANSELGPTWDPESSLYNKGLASYGSAQLQWIWRELAEDKPSVLLFHYPLLHEVTARRENPQGFPQDLPELVRAYGGSNLKLTLTGHVHHWLNFLNLFQVPHFVIGATRYDENNFWLVEFNRLGTYRILDARKAIWGSVYSRPWTYNGHPRPAAFSASALE